MLGSTYLVLHDRGRAEEVTQDAFVRLYERWGKAVSIDHPVVEVVDREGPAQAEPHDVDLLRAVAGLPPQQRAAVALYYLEDRPVDEVAHLLEVAPATVRQHLFRARKHLCDVLGEAVAEEVSNDADR